MIKRIIITVLILLTFFPFLIENTYSDEKRGRELFEEKRCVRCHTIGRGKFVGPDLYKIGNKYGEEDIVSWIVNPQVIYQKLKKMPVNQGYPSMPKLNVSESDAREIKDFLIYNNIKKTENKGGDIIGKVINKSTANSAEGVDLYLQSFIGDKKTGERLSITNEKGEFNFTNLKWDNSYSLKIKSNGIEYETAKMVFPPDQEVIKLNLPIFDASDDVSVVNINLNHEVISIDGKIVSVAEIFEIENSSNKIYVGKKEKGSEINKTLKFYIPKEAQNINFIQGITRENTIREGNTIYDTVSLPPGNKRVVITYELPIEFGKNNIEKEIYYNTKTMLMLATESDMNISVNGLNEMDPISVDNQNYLRWVGENIKTGSSIKINYFSTSLEFKKSELYPIIIFTILFLSAVIFSLVVLKRKNKNLNSQNLIIKREKIINQIAQLDIQHENDEIDPDNYKIFRYGLKKSLILLEDMIQNSTDRQNKTE